MHNLPRRLAAQSNRIWSAANSWESPVWRSKDSDGGRKEIHLWPDSIIHQSNPKIHPSFFYLRKAKCEQTSTASADMINATPPDMPWRLFLNTGPLMTKPRYRLTSALCKASTKEATRRRKWKYPQQESYPWLLKLRPKGEITLQRRPRDSLLRSTLSLASWRQVKAHPLHPRYRMTPSVPSIKR